MSRENDILRKKYDMLLDALEQSDPIKYPQEFLHVLDLLDRLHFAMGERHPVETLNATCNPVERSEPSIEEFAPPVITPLPDPIPEMEEPTEETKTYTKEEVRAELAKARKRGVNVAELLQEFGVDQFPAVPASRYGELMDKLAEL